MPHWRRNNKSRSWLVSVNVDGKRHLKTFPGTLTKREISAREREWRHELENPVATSDHTVSSLLERYWHEKGQYRAHNRTLKGHLEVWVTELGPNTAAAQVQAQNISAIIARWRKEPRTIGTKDPLRDSTINRRTDSLRVAWHYASDVLGVPVVSIPWKLLRLTEPELPDRSIGKSRSSALLAAWPARSHSVAALALATGLRMSALLRLERKDIDFERSIIRTVTKGRGGGKPVVAAVSSQARVVLEGMKLPDVGKIFTVTERQLRADRETARKVADLEGFRFHDFRHEFSQRLEDAGEGHHITDALHHTSPAMRRRYAKARVDITRQAIDRAQGR